MIPDKIYIRHYWMPGELDDEWRLKPVEDEQCEEYIRKDTLLKWIQEVRAIPHENAIVRDLAFQEVINKLNSM